MAKKELSKEEKLVKLLAERGTITLKARYGKTQGPLVICPVSDPVTGQMRGVKIYSEEEQKKQPRIVTPDVTRKITDGMTFSNSNVIDKTDWEWIVFNKEIAGSRKEAWQDEQTLFYVDDYEEEQKQKVSQRELKLEASMAVKNLSDAEKSELIRLFGVKPDYMKPADISEFLYDKADKFPEMVMERINDENKKEKIFVFELIENGIIKEDYDNKVFLYKEVKIAATFEGILAWISEKENIDLVREMRLALDKKK